MFTFRLFRLISFREPRQKSNGKKPIAYHYVLIAFSLRCISQSIHQKPCINAFIMYWSHCLRLKTCFLSILGSAQIRILAFFEWWGREKTREFKWKSENEGEEEARSSNVWKSNCQAFILMQFLSCLTRRSCPHSTEDFNFDGEPLSASDGEDAHLNGRRDRKESEIALPVRFSIIYISTISINAQVLATI